MESEKILDRNRAVLRNYLNIDFFGMEYRADNGITEYSTSLGRQFILEGIKARLAYEVARRSEQEGFCDQLEPSGSDKENSRAVSVKEGVRIDWFYMPFAPNPAGLHLFAPTRSPKMTDIRLPTSVADLWKLEAAHNTLYPVYRSQAYVDLCEARGIKPENMIVPNAHEFWRNWFKDKIEGAEFDPDKPLLGQLDAHPINIVNMFWPATHLHGKTEEEIVANLLKEFGDEFIRGDGYFNKKVNLFDRRRREAYGNPGWGENVNPADGKVKIQKLRADSGYRKDASVFSRMQIEGAADNLERVKDGILEQVKKNTEEALQTFADPKPDFPKPEKVFNAVREMIQHYQKEMVCE